MPKVRVSVLHVSGQALVVAWLLVGLSGCDFFRSAPETRAKYFIELLVTEPDAVQELRRLSRAPASQHPEQLAEGLPTRVTIDYLRARHQSAAPLRFHISGIEKRGKGSRLATIVVSEAAARPTTHSQVQFRVELEHVIDYGWLVTRFQAD